MKLNNDLNQIIYRFGKMQSLKMLFQTLNNSLNIARNITHIVTFLCVL